MKAYEAAYLIHPDATPESVVTIAGSITQAIEKLGGSIQFVAEPKKRKLAYFVGKASHAYFGYTDFTLEEARSRDLEKAIQEHKEIIRFLVVLALKANPAFREKPFVSRTAFVRPERKTAYDAVLKHPKQANNTEVKTDIETIDKKLDEILNK